MTKSSAAEHNLLDMLFRKVSFPGVASANGGSLFIALHTSDPGEDGTQATNEVAYTGYSRVQVARTSANWQVSAHSVRPLAAVTFGQMTGGVGGKVTHFSVGLSAGSVILYSGTVTPNITVAAGIIPQLSTDSEISED